MVQYILTPWRDRQELLLVRHQFYPDAGSSRLNEDPTCFGHDRRIQHPGQQHHRQTDDDHRSHDGQAPSMEAQQREQKHKAVARVSMWVQRGNCPHMVESTALLMAALLSDEERMCYNDNTTAATVAQAGRMRSSNDIALASSSYAIRAAYSTAFSRFVTGLLDGQQDKQRKQSMYSLAKTVGLPATFVELRHQSTHEQLPSLPLLRSAARKALAWIWNYYWKNISASIDDEADDGVAIRSALTCDEGVRRYLRADDEDGTRLAELTSRWDKEELRACVSRVLGSVMGIQAYVKCVSLAQRLQEQHQSADVKGSVGDLGEVHAPDQPSPVQGEGVTARADLDDKSVLSSGWATYEGTWTPKPIGIV